MVWRACRRVCPAEWRVLVYVGAGLPIEATKMRRGILDGVVGGGGGGGGGGGRRKERRGKERGRSFSTDFFTPSSFANQKYLR